MEKKKLVIAGCGKLGNIVADAVVGGLLDGYELVGAYSRSREKAETLALKVNERNGHCMVADNMSRGLPYDATNLLMLSIRNLYGITCLIGIAVLIIFLLWDVQPVRSTLKKMPSWNFVGKRMKKKKGFAK